MLGAMQRHRVVRIEFLLAYRTRKFLVGIFVLFHVRVEAVAFEAGKLAVGNGTFERFPCAVNFRHVRDFRASMNENFVAMLAHEHLVRVKRVHVFA